MYCSIVSGPNASLNSGVLKCFFLYRTAEVGDGMPGKRRRSGSTPRRYRLFIGRAGSPRDAPLLDSKTVCCTAIAVARQQNRLLHSNRPLLDSKTVCCTAIAVARQQNRLLHSNRPLLDSKTVCCTAIMAAMQQTDFPRSNSVFIVQESG